MGKFYNKPQFKDRRRGLRKTQTEFERMLWNRLRNRQCNGYKFFRQYSVGSYILDFYCPKLKLSIELDGGQHSVNYEYDNIRTEYLKAEGITELRFWNNEISGNLGGVYERILDLTPPQSSSLKKGRG